METINDRIKSHICDICDQTYKNSGNLQIHIKTIHKGAKNYKCDFCDKDLSQLKHPQFHNKCVLCYNVFTTCSKLKEHEVDMHSKHSKIHTCYSCDKAFVTPSKLKRHIITVHEGLKNYNCY